MESFLIGFVIGSILVWVAYGIMIRIATKQAQEQIQTLVSAIEKEAKNIIQARVELHDGIFYVYNTNDGSFMAQGTTMTEIRQSIESRWHEARVYVTEGEKDVIEALKQTGSDLETRRV